MPPNIPTRECLEDMCEGVGTCVTYYPDELIEMFECACDFWHTGQRCELSVPFPIVSASVTTFLSMSVLLFCWYSSRRYRKKKTYTDEHVYRFVDHLNKTLKNEKKFLNELHAQEDTNIEHKETLGNEVKTYELFDSITPPVEKQKDVVEVEKSARTVPVKKPKPEKPDVKKTTGKPEEDVNKTTRNDKDQQEEQSGGTGGSTEMATMSAEAARSVAEPRSLAHVPSNQLVPIDAPPDQMKAAKAKREQYRQLEAEQKKRQKEDEEAEARERKEAKEAKERAAQKKSVKKSHRKTPKEKSVMKSVKDKSGSKSRVKSVRNSAKSKLKSVKSTKNKQKSGRSKVAEVE